MKSQKQAPFRLGESGWEVQWCSKAGMVDDNDWTLGGDPDKDVLHEHHFRSLEDAKVFAEKIYPKDQHGCVRLTAFTIEPLSDEWPYGRTKTYTSDSEYFSGEWE